MKTSLVGFGPLWPGVGNLFGGGSEIPFWGVVASQKLLGFDLHNTCKTLAQNPVISTHSGAFGGIGLHFTGVAEVAVKALEISYLAVIQQVATTALVRCLALRAKTLSYLHVIVAQDFTSIDPLSCKKSCTDQEQNSIACSYKGVSV